MSNTTEKMEELKKIVTPKVRSKDRMKRIRKVVGELEFELFVLEKRKPWWKKLFNAALLRLKTLFVKKGKL